MDYSELHLGYLRLDRLHCAWSASEEKEIGHICAKTPGTWVCICACTQTPNTHTIRFLGLETDYISTIDGLMVYSGDPRKSFESLQITCPSLGISPQLWVQLQREVSPLRCYQLGRHVDASRLERHHWAKQDPHPILGRAWGHPFTASTWDGAATYIAGFMPCLPPWMGARLGSQRHMPFGEASMFSRSKIWSPASKCIHIFYKMDQR